jgi:FSR family fosmidomycin resistance protein-like MFS transporter
LINKLNKPGANALVASCGAHAIQDGLSALQYVLLPILAQLFNLNYAQVGFLRAVSHSAMSALEIPAGILSEKTGERKLLSFGLVCAGSGYLGLAFSPQFFLVAVCLLIAGVGAGFQHSLSSAIVVRSFQREARRRALGTYNSAGDAGKLAFTAAFSVGIGAGFAWNAVLIFLSLISMTFGLIVWRILRNYESREMAKNESGHRSDEDSESVPEHKTSKSKGWGIKHPCKFAVLGTVVFLDSVVQAVFLTFLAFVVLDKGAGETLASFSVVIALIGGMVGKFACGFLAGKYGDRFTFVMVQGLNVIGIALLVVLPLTPLLIVLPLIGLVTQGTSTVTYGSVSEFVDHDKQSRGYALIYTVASISSMVGPLLVGMVADYAGLDMAMWLLALIALIPLPMAFVLGKAGSSI